MKNYLILATAALALAACSNNENDPADTDGQPVPVEFCASVGVTETRAIDQTWSATDAIGIFMVKAGQVFLPENLSEGAENIRYVVNGASSSVGAFKPDGTTLYYPMNDSKVDFYAYCPQGSVTKEEITTHYLYAINVSTQTNQEALDLLYSNDVKGKKKTDKTAALGFKHQLCKVILTVQPGEGVSDMNGLTVKVNAQNTTATFDLTAGALKTDAGTSQDITLFKQTGAYIYEAILLPDAATGRTFEFDLNNGHDAPFAWDMNKALTAGSKYTYTVKLNRTGVEVSGQIEAWNPETGGTVDAN